MTAMASNVNLPTNLMHSAIGQYQNGLPISNAHPSLYHSAHESMTSHASPAVATAATLATSGKECIVCLERQANCAIVNCGHCLCDACVATLKRDTAQPRCPFCRAAIGDTVRLVEGRFRLGDLADTQIVVKPRCESCKQRPISVSLETCGHFVCHDCSMTSHHNGEGVEGRTRHCPFCQTGFTDADVVYIYRYCNFRLSR